MTNLETDMTTIEQAHAQRVDELRGYRKILTAETEGVDRALEALCGPALFLPPVAAKATPAKRRAPKAVAQKRRAPKRSARPARKPSRRPRASSSDEPRVAKGRLPTKGVESYAPESAQERQKKVLQLRADGYVRVGPGAPLSPGSFDVRKNDAHGVVLWRPKAEEE